MRTYHFDELRKFGDANAPKNYRIARIVAVNDSSGTVNIKWMDHPGGREDIQINQSAFGNWEFPVINSVVLVGMREEIPEILRYIPLSYVDQVQSNRVPALLPGEKLFVSYRQEGDTVDEVDPIPTPTGTTIKMDNLGRVIISTGSGDGWVMDPLDNSITSDSVIHHIETEAGVLDFGVAEREYPSVIPGGEEDTRTVFKDSVTGKAFTEFRLRVLDSSDADPTTAPDVDDPFIELILGTKLKKVGSGAFTTYTPDQSKESRDIAISLIVKSKGAGDVTPKVAFLFQVDKDGNVQMEVDGKTTLVCDDIELGGGGDEQPVVLKSFLTDYYNSHTQAGNLGFPTGVPVIPAPTVSPTVSSKTKVE